MHSLHLSLEALISQPNEWKSHVLGGISFSGITDKSTSEITDFPFALVNMPVLEGNESSSEIWMSDHKVNNAQRGLIKYNYDEDIIFGVLLAPQTTLSLEETTESAFQEIFSLLEDSGYAYIFRFWNYLTNINGNEAVNNNEILERYRQFNLGRQDAFIASGRKVTGNLPAACALGTAGGPLTIAFMAGRTPTLAVENPRQISAYQYPNQYGPRSPSFSRANMVDITHADQSLEQQKILFISGTASIVGHETRHHSDAAAQTCETLVNIEAVIHEANKKAGACEFSMNDLLYRVYVRRQADFPTIRAEMGRVLGHSFKAVFLQADICRTDLLVEIEATAASTIRLPEAQYA